MQLFSLSSLNHGSRSHVDSRFPFPPSISVRDVLGTPPQCPSSLRRHRPPPPMKGVEVFVILFRLFSRVAFFFFPWKARTFPRYRTTFLPLKILGFLNYREVTSTSVRIEV